MIQSYCFTFGENKERNDYLRYFFMVTSTSISIVIPDKKHCQFLIHNALILDAKLVKSK